MWFLHCLLYFLVKFVLRIVPLSPVLHKGESQNNSMKSLGLTRLTSVSKDQTVSLLKPVTNAQLKKTTVPPLPPHLDSGRVCHSATVYVFKIWASFL